ncbi:hypothetical protein DL96DRAFT_1683229 [Flagelloscypha sp. PMI_526]|nr:hypothetical protein DL96DRAFT_1683229 [Flagelloscypha sp. PMI_526]
MPPTRSKFYICTLEKLGEPGSCCGEEVSTRRTAHHNSRKHEPKKRIDCPFQPCKYKYDLGQKANGYNHFKSVHSGMVVPPAWEAEFGMKKKKQTPRRFGESEPFQLDIRPSSEITSSQSPSTSHSPPQDTLSPLPTPELLEYSIPNNHSPQTVPDYSGTYPFFVDQQGGPPLTPSTSGPSLPTTPPSALPSLPTPFYSDFVMNWEIENGQFQSLPCWSGTDQEQNFAMPLPPLFYHQNLLDFGSYSMNYQTEYDIGYTQEPSSSRDILLSTF